MNQKSYENILDTLKQDSRFSEVVETRMSWVFFSEHYVYKMKKPQKFDAVDLSTLSARHRNCQQEVRLNSRISPDVYVGVLAVVYKGDKTIEIGGEGEIVEYLVKMKRLPRHRLLNEILENNYLKEDELNQVIKVLCHFFINSPTVFLSTNEYQQRFQDVINNSYEDLWQNKVWLKSFNIEELHFCLLQQLNECSVGLDERVKQGHVVEGHGDLRPEHICLLDPPRVIDCLEFNRELRINDKVDELAYLSMECERISPNFDGHLIFQKYTELTGDAFSMEIADFYKSCRAFLRARQAILHLDAPKVRGGLKKWVNLTKEYLSLAQGYSNKVPRRENSRLKKADNGPIRM